MKKSLLAIVAACAVLPAFSSATHAIETKFSLGSGYPFFVVPTLILESDSLAYYVNYKAGLDDGFSIGVQSIQGKHIFGAFAGAVGTRDVKDYCKKIDVVPCISGLLVLDSYRTTQGVGLSYEYRFNTKPNGWAVRIEAGYGKESRTDDKRADGNVQVVYHF